MSGDQGDILPCSRNGHHDARIHPKPTGKNEVTKKIKDVGISSIVDLKKHNLNYKIREHSLAKIPILLICGKKEVDSKSVTIRRLDSNKQENMELNKFLKTFSALNKVSSI